MHRNSIVKITAVCTALLMLIAVPDTFAQRKKHKKHEDAPKMEEKEPWEVDTLIQPIPLNRSLFTDKVKKQQLRLDMRDGVQDNNIHYMDDKASEIVTKALIDEVNLLEIHIENMPIEHREKIQFHRYVEGMLTRVSGTGWSPRPAVYFKHIVDNLRDMIFAIVKNNLVQYVSDNVNDYTYFNSFVLDDYKDAKTAFFTAYGKAYPERMIKSLEGIANEPYADDVVAAVAQKDPGTILNYATSTSYMNTVMRRNKDKMVQTIVKIADQSRNPLKVLPFVGEIYDGNRTVGEIDAIADNDVAYYKALVGLKIKGEQVASDKIDEEVTYRALRFVRTINELHESPDAVRFKCIQPFDAAEQYYLMIGGQDEIYTSSFTHGTFPLMMDRMKPQAGDEFLEKIHNDHFRTFIRLCAGFNTLSTFLSSMPEDKKSALMKQFVDNLELGGDDDLEDAVDVADAFGSITDPKLQDFLRNEVKKNYERVYNDKNAASKKGVIVYGLLGSIFNPDKSAQESLPIPPITFVPYQALVNDKKEVIIETFFYGDEDGKMSFNSFKSNFPAGKWTYTQNKNWATFKSTAGKNPITVYANLPLEEPADEQAQNAMQQYLDENEIVPTILIHRGHSYHLDESLKHLTPDIKIVMLGSCGGYHNLAKVLDRSPDANIISSKQTGSMYVNEPIISEMISKVMAGSDVDWVNCWNDLDNYFSKKSKGEQDLFSDYVPPNKNLGAIFIKAYRKMMADDDSE